MHKNRIPHDAGQPCRTAASSRPVANAVCVWQWRVNNYQPEDEPEE